VGVALFAVTTVAVAAIVTVLHRTLS